MQVMFLVGALHFLCPPGHTCVNHPEVVVQQQHIELQDSAIAWEKEQRLAAEQAMMRAQAKSVNQKKLAIWLGSTLGMAILTLTVALVVETVDNGPN